MTNGEYDILGTIEEWEPSENEIFTCAIAEPKGRESVVYKLKQKGASFTSIIHPDTHISDYCTLGEGIILYWYTFIGPNAVIGNFSFLQAGVSHDCHIGDFSTISRDARLSGGVVVGQRVFIGSNATIIPGKTIDNDAYVGAGSVVIRNVKPNSKVFGNPARKVDV